jgi:hypothetical protein
MMDLPSIRRTLSADRRRLEMYCCAGYETRGSGARLTTSRSDLASVVYPYTYLPELI